MPFLSISDVEVCRTSCTKCSTPQFFCTFISPKGTKEKPVCKLHQTATTKLHSRKVLIHTTKAACQLTLITSYLGLPMDCIIQKLKELQSSLISCIFFYQVYYDLEFLLLQLGKPHLKVSLTAGLQFQPKSFLHYFIVIQI